MSITNQSDPNPTRQITLLIPESVYQQAAQTASDEQREVEELLSTLIVEGLNAHATTRQIFEWVSAQYCDRLSETGKTNQSSEEVMQELQDLREQVAHEIMG